MSAASYSGLLMLCVCVCVQADGTCVIWRVRCVCVCWAGSWLCWRFWSWLCWSLSPDALCSGTHTSTPLCVCTDPPPSERSCWSTHSPRTCTTGWDTKHTTHPFICPQKHTSVPNYTQIMWLIQSVTGHCNIHNNLFMYSYSYHW